VMRHGRIVENRALEGAVAGLARVRLAFAQAVEALESKLAALPGVRVLRAEADAAVLELHGGAEVQAALLRALVQAGLPLAEFALERENLHESYLRTVGAAPA